MSGAVDHGHWAMCRHGRQPLIGPLRHRVGNPAEWPRVQAKSEGYFWCFSDGERFRGLPPREYYDAGTLGLQIQLELNRHE